MTATTGSIKTWQKFARDVRPGRTDLLRELPKYPGAILISGCQRSGGTMLARAINQHPDVEDLSWSKDAELDAAQILSGTASIPAPEGKQCCFQTTYLNERGVEYLDQPEAFYLIWLIRNPYSVVYSMLHNWARFALNEVFIGCGLEHVPEVKRARFNRWGLWGISPRERACYAYLGKLRQAKELLQKLPAGNMVTLQYEELVTDKEQLLASLFEFAQLAPLASGGDDISTRSLKKKNKLSQKERVVVDAICSPEYEEFLANSISLSV